MESAEFNGPHAEALYHCRMTLSPYWRYEEANLEMIQAGPSTIIYT